MRSKVVEICLLCGRELEKDCKAGIGFSGYEGMREFPLSEALIQTPTSRLLLTSTPPKRSPNLQEHSNQGI